MPMTNTAVKRVFLVGFMGAGKTTLGESVARELELDFYDIDDRITREAGMSIEDIFRREGEPSFRRRETEALRQLLAETESGVIALGGGTFTLEHNRRLVREAGQVVWLDVPFDELRERIDGHARPLWTDAEEARSLHAARLKAYALADHRLDLRGLSATEAQARLLSLLSRLCSNR